MAMNDKKNLKMKFGCLKSIKKKVSIFLIKICHEIGKRLKACSHYHGSMKASASFFSP